MIPPCCVAAFGRALKVSFDVIVQAPSAGWRRMFLAVFVVVTRSPVSGVIVTAPPPTVRLAGVGRMTAHLGASGAPVNSSLGAGWGKGPRWVATVASRAGEGTGAPPRTAGGPGPW